MTLEMLRCFVAVADCGGFHKAALRLNRTQPSVSQQVRALEKELGSILLDRKSCNCTEKGALLIEEARQILYRTDDLAARLRDFDEDTELALRIACSDTTATYTLPEVVKRFLRDRPQTRLALLNKGSATIEEEIIGGSLDLGIVTAHTANTQLTYKELSRHCFVAVMPKGHPLEKRRNINLSLLSNEKMLLLDESTRSGKFIWDCFRNVGIAPKVLLNSGSYDVIRAHVQTGLGVSIFPEIMLRKKIAGLSVVPISGFPRLPVGLIWRTGVYQSNALKHFIKILQDIGGD